MSDKLSSLLNAEELEALIQGWGIQPQRPPVDVFYVTRLAFNVLTMFGFAIWLLVDSPAIAASLSSHTATVEYLSGYLYFRGWLVLSVLAVGLYIYVKDFYVGVFFSIFFLMGTINFITDLFTLYPERLANPTPMFTLNILLRLAVLWVIFIAITNLSRRPSPADRFNVFLPLRRGAGRS